MPDVTGVHIPRALNTLSLHYRNGAYVADVFAPIIPVVKESDRYFVYGRESFKVGNARRADKTKTQEVTYSLSTDQYYTEEYGYHVKISERERDNSDEPLRPDMDATEHLTELLLLDREFRFVDETADPTNTEWGDYAATHFTNLGSAWGDPNTSDIRTDIYNAKRVVFRDSRRMANRMAVPTDVAFIMSLASSLDELRKYTDPGLLTNSGLPSKLFGLDVTEAQSSYDESVNGGTADYTETWGNNVLVAFVNPRSLGLKTLTFALTMQSRAFRVRKWRDESIESDIIENTHIEDRKIVAPACGYWMLNAATPLS